MLGTPNSGSEIADRLKNFGAYRAFFGPAGQQLGTQRDAAIEALFPPVDYPVGIIAGNRSIDPVAGTMLPKPHDGRVSVANTRLDGMADHIVGRGVASVAGAEFYCDRADDCVFARRQVQIVGWAKRSVPTILHTARMVGTAQMRLCRPCDFIPSGRARHRSINATRPIALRSINSRIARA